MDCADCAARIERALGRVAGVESAHVSLGTGRATVVFDPLKASKAHLAQAVEALGYSVPGSSAPGLRASLRARQEAAPRLFGIASGLFVVAVAGVVLIGLAVERLGLIEAASRLVPAPVALAAVLVGGLPVFRKVFLAVRARSVTPHALMTLGIAGALIIGEYGAAAVIVFFMRFADFLDAYTAGRARQAIQELVAQQPLEARIIRDGIEIDVPASEVGAGEIVLVKPGERIPVDGTIISGRASINQAPITGEAMPVERTEGQAVLAATISLDGALRIRAEHVGADSTFGRIVRLVEEAEAHKSGAQRLADRVTAYYIPVVTVAAAAAWLIGGSASAGVAVLVVSCSCGIALATPVAVVAAVGSAARRGILVKGGTALEGLARAEILLLDKTGTLTVGRPQVTRVRPDGSRTTAEVLAVAAIAERYSEHPAAAAVMAAAPQAGGGEDAAQIEVAPGRGVIVREHGRQVVVGSQRLFAERDLPLPERLTDEAAALEAAGQTVLFVADDGCTVGLIAIADAPRPEVPEALRALRTLGLERITMLTGDNARAARAIADALGVDHRAEMLPEDKIAVVQAFQAEGRVVAMVGDGINDAPALAQADVGIAMGATGTSAALEAADVAIMRDDWRLVPDAVRIGREAFGVIRQNLYGTVAYNLTGIVLAAVGLLPPVLAAAAQVIPDFLILLNSGRLLRSGGRG
ncbi:MAG: cation-translocating P-type ATPase [Armatimonadetes bacterium]|nr:cation-translocating P-type ATPase [Armatimonadota bacterium]